MDNRRGSGFRRAFVATALALTTFIGAAALAQASRHHSLTRKQADHIALRLLRPGSVQEPAHEYVAVYGLPSALRAGSVVSQPTLGLIPSGGKSIKLRHAAWLFWEDLDYDAEFVHPSVMLLVDAGSGRVVARRSLELYPVVGGKMPAFLVSSKFSRFEIFSDVPGGLAAADGSTRARAAFPYRAHLADNSYSNAGFIGVADNRTPGWQGSQFSTDAIQTGNTFTAHGVESQSAGSRAQLNSAVAAMEQRDGKNNITIFLAGHGSPAPGTPNPHGGTYNGREQPTVSLGPGGDDITAAYLNQLMAAHPNTKFNFIIGSCMSGRFQPDQANGLKGPNLGTVSTSASPDESSYFTDHSADEADPFTTASNQALTQAFKDDTTGDINNVLAKAKALEPSLDTSAKEGKTHPQSTEDYPIPKK